MQDDRPGSAAAFEVGKLHANDTIHRALSVGNAGGVRVALDGSGRVRRIALFTRLQAHAAGCIVTTSHFSRAALLEAREPGKIPIQVIDGRELAAWTRQVGYPLD